METENSILRRLKRRIGSARAAVMLEFAFIAPLAVALIVFAADFSRILRTEQQLEIAARLMADVESHMADYYGSSGECPSSVTKQVGKRYLQSVARVISSVTEDAFVKGSCDTVMNPMSKIVTLVAEIFGEDIGKSSESEVLKLLAKILGGIVNFVTFRTIKYLTDIVPHDKEVRITCAAKIPTILPSSAYSLFSLPTRSDGIIGIGQFTPDLKSDAGGTAWGQTIDLAGRHRVYCYMPVVDSVPIAPETYVRKIKSFFAKFF